MKRRKNLISLRERALQLIDSAALLRTFGARPEPDEAVLCWGKAAPRFWQGLAAGLERKSKAPPALVIAPAGTERLLVGCERPGARFVFGEHPLPGPGSFAAGAALLDFFDALSRARVRKLRVYLSGGASSLAWIRPVSLAPDELQRALRELYSRPLPIDQLNRERAKLCMLKNGGAALWLARLAPRVRARVELISDVAPFGPRVVGSGPFWRTGVSHRVLADNSSFVEAFARAGREAGLAVISSESARLGEWSDWVARLARLAREASAARRSGLLLLGGEPAVSLPAHAGSGGRQTQIAAALACELADLVESGSVAEILCTSSDGVDGNSRAAGAFIDARALRRFDRARMKRALRDFDTACELARMGALIPARSTGSNVQDLVAIRAS